MKPRRPVVAAAVLLVAATLLWLRPWTDRAEAGTLVSADRPNPERQVQVQVPDGSVRVGVGVPTREPELGIGEGAPDLARGDAFWPVSLFVGDRSDEADGGLPEPEVVLDIDGVRTTLEQEADDAGSSASDWYVVAPDDADEVTLEVTYDGVTQTADLATGEIDTGLAAGLYEPWAGVARECGVVLDGLPARLDYAEISEHCAAYGLSTTPYDPELGWVDRPEQRWVTVQEPSLEGPGYLAWGDGPMVPSRPTGPIRYLLDGDAPETTRPTGTGSVRSRTLVFRADSFPRQLVGRRGYVAGRTTFELVLTADIAKVAR